MSATQTNDHVTALLEAYGVTDIVSVRSTESELDLTWLVDTESGGVVLKESPVGSETAIMQGSLLEHVAEAAPALPVPRVLHNVATGRVITETSGGTAFVSTFCRGVPLEQVPITEALVSEIVELQSQMIAALRSCDATELHVPATNDWCIDAVGRYAPLVELWAPVAHRPFLDQAIADFAAVVEPLLPALPVQVIHGDFNLSNLLVSDGSVTGIIDFGDAVHAPRVYDVAVTACYLALAVGDLDHELVTRYLAAMTAQCSLVAAESAVLRTLVLCRLAIVLLLSREIAHTEPTRAEYVLRYDALAERLLDSTDVVADASASRTMK